MKKILFILPSLEVGGLQRAQVTLANALVNRGYDVTVLILDPIYDLEPELDKRVRLVNKPYKKHIGQKIPYIRHRYYDDGMWETRTTPKQLYKYYIGNEKYDVEIAFFRGLSVKIVYGGSNNNKSNTKRIAWVHSDFRKATGSGNNFKTMSEVFEAYSSLDNVICVSNEAKKGFIEVIGDTGNLKTIYNILPVENIQKKALDKPNIKVTKEKMHLVLVGRLLDSAKGQKRLIDVVVRLHNEGNSISLALVGGGNDEQMLKAEITNNCAEDYITMCGNQLNPYPFIKEADLLVCASYYEGYNLTVAEAMVLGVPVLSTKCAGPSEILEDGNYGLLVNNSENAIYKGIKYLIDKPNMLEHYKKKALERNAFFNEKKIINQIESLFEGI